MSIRLPHKSLFTRPTSLSPGLQLCSLTPSTLPILILMLRLALLVVVTSICPCLGSLVFLSHTVLEFSHTVLEFAYCLGIQTLEESALQSMQIFGAQEIVDTLHIMAKQRYTAKGLRDCWRWSGGRWRYLGSSRRRMLQTRCGLTCGCTTCASMQRAAQACGMVGSGVRRALAFF